MPHPVNGYVLNGARVPSVTTIIGRFGDKEGLMRWAWKCGTENKDYRTEGKNAARAGSAAHDAIESSILGRVPDWDKLAIDHKLGAEQTAWAQTAHDAFTAWRKEACPLIDEMEIKYICEQYQYGGTPDAIGKLRGNFDMIDWKTSKSLNADYILQGAAYVNMWEEHHDRRLDGLTIVRFDKFTGKSEEKRFTRDDLDSYFDLFLELRQAYDTMTKLGVLKYKKL